MKIIDEIKALYSFCEEIKQTTKKSEKEKILLNYNNNILILEFLSFLFNPRTITGISKAKLNKTLDIKDCSVKVETIKELYQYLTKNNTGRDIDIVTCQNILSKISEKKLYDFFFSIVTKNLKIGIEAKTVNNVISGLIPVHEVMQGSPRDKLRLKKGEEFYLTQKLNGNRCTYVNGELISRQGIPFTGLGHIIKDLKQLEQWFGNSESIVFDGELVRKNTDGLSDNANFTLGTGIINSDGKDKSCIQFILFDWLPLKEFQKGKSNKNYSERNSDLHTMLWGIEDNNLSSLNIVTTVYIGSDSNMIDECLNRADEAGWEGLMLAHSDAPYECKRSTKLIKIKSFKHSDLRIVGYEEGEGKYVGMLGAIIVEYKDNTTNVGSGFSDQQRIDFWENKEELIGKIAQVKFKEVTTDKKTGLESLQFPVFELIRNDKTEPSYE